MLRGGNLLELRVELRVFLLRGLRCGGKDKKGCGEDEKDAGHGVIVTRMPASGGELYSAALSLSSCVKVSEAELMQ